MLVHLREYSCIHVYMCVQYTHVLLMIAVSPCPLLPLLPLLHRLFAPLFTYMYLPLPPLTVLCVSPTFHSPRFICPIQQWLETVYVVDTLSRCFVALISSSHKTVAMCISSGAMCNFTCSTPTPMFFTLLLNLACAVL